MTFPKYVDSKYMGLSKFLKFKNPTKNEKELDIPQALRHKAQQTNLQDLEYYLILEYK